MDTGLDFCIAICHESNLPDAESACEAVEDRDWRRDNIVVPDDPGSSYRFADRNLPASRELRYRRAQLFPRAVSDATEHISTSWLTSSRRTHLCGFDLNFTYPETNGPLPVLTYPEPTDPDSPYNIETASLLRQRMLRMLSSASLRKLEKFSKREHSKDLLKRDIVREAKRQQWKRDLSLRANGTLDSWYACFLETELYGTMFYSLWSTQFTHALLDYMVNYTVPWGMFAP